VETPAVVEAPAPLTPQPLTFGQGDGKQPAPDYPRESLRQGQEGTVTVRMTVGEDGRVLAAEDSSPSPWPLLNNAAVRVVKSRWRFAPGPVRAYEVAIRFQLNK
jgi:protein TonB